MRDSAIVAYERYLTTPEMNKPYTDAWLLAPTRERLGDLYIARGDTARAIAHLTAFVEQWRDADPELQPRVRAARTTIARLQRRST